MIEHQFDHSLNFQHNDHLSIQDSVSIEIMEGHGNPCNLPISTQVEHSESQPWETTSHDSVENRLVDWYTPQERHDFNHGEVDVSASFRNSNDFAQNLAYDSNQAMSFLHEQAYYVDHNHVEIASHTQEYNHNLWEQHFQQHHNSSLESLNADHHQRSGQKPTAHELQEARGLDEKSATAEKQYKDYTEKGKFYESHNNQNEADNYHAQAAKFKQQSEQLHSEAEKLRKES